jgi:hypothetical protein
MTSKCKEDYIKNINHTRGIIQQTFITKNLICSACFKKIPYVPYDSKYLRCVSCNMKQVTKYWNISIFATMNIKTDTKVEKVMVFSNTFCWLKIN